MSKMKNYMMDIEEFCDSYFFGVDSANEYEIEEGYMTGHQYAMILLLVAIVFAVWAAFAPFGFILP